MEHWQSNITGYTTPNSNPKKRSNSQLSASTSSPIEPLPKIPDLKEYTNMNTDNEEIVIPDLSGQNLDSKMDTVISLLSKLLTSFTDDKIDNHRQIQSLSRENELLNLRLSSSEGRTLRLENKVKALETEVEDLQCKSMTDNIVLHNFEESLNEILLDSVFGFLKDTLKIDPTMLNTASNPTGPVMIDVAYRIGQKRGLKPRSIVIKFSLSRGKNIVMNHAKNLKGTKYSISDQLPSSMRERRLAQIPKLKELRENKDDKVVLSKDRLFVNGKLMESKFEKNILSSCVQKDVAIDYNQIDHSELIELNGSRFQAHAVKANNKQEAEQARLALFQNDDIAGSDHIMYAYSVLDENGLAEIGYSDDMECNGSGILHDILSQNKLQYIFLAVSRNKNGPNLGPRRFELIKDCALDVLRMNNYIKKKKVPTATLR